MSEKTKIAAEVFKKAGLKGKVLYRELTLTKRKGAEG